MPKTPRKRKSTASKVSEQAPQDPATMTLVFTDVDVEHEKATLKNTGSKPVDLYGYSLQDLVGGHTSLPFESFVIPAGGSVTVWTAPAGDNHPKGRKENSKNVFWHNKNGQPRKAPVLNDEGDGLRLVHAEEGHEVTVVRADDQAVEQSQEEEGDEEEADEEEQEEEEAEEEAQSPQGQDEEEENAKWSPIYSTRLIRTHRPSPERPSQMKQGEEDVELVTVRRVVKRARTVRTQLEPWKTGFKDDEEVYQYFLDRVGKIHDFVLKGHTTEN
eukprot:m.126487 g.126487  ORF g.126487 m.126487 type:complete len:272 (-) comp16681_c4_seq3:103-918(-)